MVSALIPLMASRAKKGKPPLKDADGKTKKNLAPEALEKKIAQTNGKIEKMELDMKIKEALKSVALGTSKIKEDLKTPDISDYSLNLRVEKLYGDLRELE
ncbi:DNA topoisomerase 1-like protein isoform X1 [Cinnamomum micranthum f. kanehirae]|uniref:DNA topoisomerase 1-like protein isoform X1 n=1 Tax=Cinnamomum micranthum f. kanehirae TaxID=337451 RepID=A0A443PT15_9MAGN|nr:DNA topoisomerase 1-like protein isoform X1 [Cinnamomum micranthum f. kanehirae]